MIHFQMTGGFIVLLDDDDRRFLDFKWCALRSKHTAYASRLVRQPDGSRKGLLLHREILGLKKGDPIVDHINGNGLDCRRENLRLSSNAVNGRNVEGARSNNTTSPYLGVTFDRSSRKFRARITVNGEARYLGLFPTAEEANKARLLAERSLWGIEPRRLQAWRELGK